MSALSINPNPTKGIPAASAIVLNPPIVMGGACMRCEALLSSLCKSSALRSSLLCYVYALLKVTTT